MLLELTQLKPPGTGLLKLCLPMLRNSAEYVQPPPCQQSPQGLPGELGLRCCTPVSQTLAQT